MDKSEKSYYAVIGNKKRGKFSGAGPIQVAKKVASKKLKAGKEMEFYLDEVAGKKKRFGPYQARKDKKSGKVAVVKGRKVMKGGLTPDFISILQGYFMRNRNVRLNGRKTLQNIIRIVDIEYHGENKPFIFFNPETDNPETDNYNYAVFEDENGILLLFYDKSFEIIHTNFFEFFISNHEKNNKTPILNSLIYGQNEIQLHSNHELNLNKKFQNKLEVNRIKEKAKEINELLKSRSGFKIISYIQNIKLCVYLDSTFGIFDETEPYNSKLQVKNPDYNNQIFLIMKKSFFRGREPVIFLRKPIEHRSILQPFNFDVCIYEKNGSFRIHIIPQNQTHFFSISNEGTTYGFLSDIILNYKDLPVGNLEYYCETLKKIPPEFGRFRRLRAISAGILSKILQNKSQQSTPPLRRNPKNRGNSGISRNSESIGSSLNL